MVIKKMLVSLLLLALLKFSFSLTVPSAPRDFSLSPVPGEPQASWTPPKVANGVIQNYTVECNDSSIFDFGGTEVSGTLEDLEPFTVYECFVLASTDGGVGNASEAAVARTEQDGERTVLVYV